MEELSIGEEQVLSMIADNAKSMKSEIITAQIRLTAGDSYGEVSHRTWAFYLEDGLAFGSIERYWGGLKMICSIMGGSPRTSFFTESGIRTTNKGLREVSKDY